jgi:hypothetical protein
MTREDDLINNVGQPVAQVAPPPQPEVPTATQEEKIVDPIAARIAEYEANEKDKEDPEMPPIPQGQGPNVRLAKSREHDALSSGRVNIGLGVSVIIPKKAQQLEGFYTEHPSVLVHQFPQYKHSRKKGS